MSIPMEYFQMLILKNNKILKKSEIIKKKVNEMTSICHLIHSKHKKIIHILTHL